MFVNKDESHSLILGNLGTQVHKSHCDFPASWVINKLKISNLLNIFGPIFCKMLMISGKWQISKEQEPWRLPSRHAELNGTNRLRLDVHSDDQAVTGNQGYFED